MKQIIHILIKRTNETTVNIINEKLILMIDYWCDLTFIKNLVYILSQY